MSVYDSYKPLRNYLRKVPLWESLKIIHAYIQFLQFQQPIPNNIEVNEQVLSAKLSAKGIYAWELDILAREIVLNADLNGKLTLRQWKNMANAINKIKDLENDISAHSERLAPNILLELYRIQHRQFPWQWPANSNALLRYFRIFGTPSFVPILQTNLGLSVTEIYVLGLAFTGHFMDNAECVLPLNVAPLGISPETLECFVQHFSTDFPSLKKQITDTQSYDDNYAYTYNPFRFYSFIKEEIGGRPILVCPFPPYLFGSFTDGVYYKICKSDGFSKAFGDSFQQYVGDAANAANSQKQLSILPEAEYNVGNNRKDSVDWIISDATAEIFVECKAKRLLLDAKVSLESAALDKDLDMMAGFIVQNYRTLMDALQGHYPHWKPSNKNIYLVVVTLEEWYIWGEIARLLNEKVLFKMEKLGIDAAIIEKHPYIVCSMADLELAMLVMDKNGIEKVMSQKTTGEQQGWHMLSFLMNVFKNELKEIRESKKPLFPEDYKKIHPALAHA